MKTAQLERLPLYLNEQARVLEAPRPRDGLRPYVGSEEIERVRQRIANSRRKMAALAARRSAQAVPAWYQPARERLKYLATLAEGWDSYGAEAPNSFALAMAEETLRLMVREGLEPFGIVPSAENGIGIVFRQGTRQHGKHADIEIFNDGDVCYLVDDRQNRPRAHQVTADAAGLSSALRSIRDFFDL